MAPRTTLYLCAQDQFDSAQLGNLSKHERERADAYAHRSDRQRFVLGRAVLRWALSEQLGSYRPADWSIGETRGGKPTLELCSEAIGFSISHTEGLVAVLLSSNRSCGVDVELLSRQIDVQKLAQRSCSLVERKWLNRHDLNDQSVAFLKLWTLKEAYLKATGIGISVPLNQLSFGFDDGIYLRDLEDQSKRFDHWNFSQWEQDGRHLVAVAQRRGDSQLQTIVLRAVDAGFEKAIKDERTA